MRTLQKRQLQACLSLCSPLFSDVFSVTLDYKDLSEEQSLGEEAPLISLTPNTNESFYHSGLERISSLNSAFTVLKNQDHWILGAESTAEVT